MSDESELNRLRADLEKFASLSLRYRADVQIRDHQNYLRNKIAELEAAADPWREAREAVPLHMKIAGLQDEVARLTARVGELEAGILVTPKTPNPTHSRKAANDATSP